MHKRTLLTLAFAALAFAQEPAPFSKTEKAAISTKLQQRQTIIERIEALQRQLQDLGRETDEIVAEAYGARKIEQKDWQIKGDLSGWVKPAPVAVPPAEVPAKKEEPKK